MAHGIFFFLPRARGARRFSARRAALVAARRPALPVVHPMARDGALPIARPGACGGFVARRGVSGARARPPPSNRPSWRPRGAVCRPLLLPVKVPSGGPHAAPPAAHEPPLQPTCRPCSPRAARAASCPRATAGWRVWGWRVCESYLAPPPPLSPTAAAAAEGGGCVGAEGVVLGGCVVGLKLGVQQGV
ncbi:unnamed protein product [Closterium sp. NIES-53]